MKKGKGYIVSEKEFNNAKLLQEAGLKASKVVELTGRSWVTVNRMYKADNFGKYQEAVALDNSRVKALRQAQKEAEQPQEEVAVPDISGYEPASEAEKSAITLLENLTVEVKRLSDGFDRLENEVEAVIAAKKVAFWRN